MTLAIIDCVLIVFYVMNSAVIGSMQPLGLSINDVISFSKYFKLFLSTPCQHFFLLIQQSGQKSLGPWLILGMKWSCGLRSYLLNTPQVPAYLGFKSTLLPWKLGWKQLWDTNIFSVFYSRVLFAISISILFQFSVQYFWSPYVSMFLVLKISKNWPFLTPPQSSLKVCTYVIYEWSP